MAVLAVAAIASAACSGETAPRAARPRSELVSDTTRASFTVRESVNQLSVTGADPGQELAVFDGDGRKARTAAADDQGSLVFRELREGRGYRVQAVGDLPAPTSPPLRVMSVGASTPPQAFYAGQTLSPGFGYITTRDGTTLSAAVYLPGPPEAGPYPTVVEYSGYSPSNPTNSLRDQVGRLLRGADVDGLCRNGLTFICNTPDQPASLLASAMGFAVVAVNMRGTGCSGGSYDFFEPLQVLDGYDIIETVAAQPWVKGQKVGMVGLSYPGISQLFVAQAQPPSLAAITPLSVIDDTARGVLAPGGIFNEGFALSWARNVLDNAKPLGQGWEQKVIDGGDRQCADNQKLRGQNVDAVEKAKKYPFYDPKVADPLNPSLFASRIRVPTFLACAFQDEQTGGRCANLADKFTSAPVAKFTFYNGAHADGFAPQVLVEWKAFLDMYLADELRPIPPLLKQFGPVLLQDTFGVPISFPEERWLSYPNAAAARKAFEAEQPVRIIFENGGGEPPGAPVGRFEARFDSLPIARASATSWYLGRGGNLRAEKPGASDGGSEFEFDPEMAKRTTLPGESEADAFKALPPYEWAQDTPGKAAVFVSEPFEKDTFVIGSGNADLWISTDVQSVDLSVTLSEVRPDGKETYVQSGWLRSRIGEPAAGSTETRPLHTGYERDAITMRPGEPTRLQMEVFPMGHLFRKGSRLRVSVHTPGGDRPRWSWILEKYARPPRITVWHSAKHPSRLVLPVVDRIEGAPADLPPCPSLRGQPCRDFQQYRNTPAS